MTKMLDMARPHCPCGGRCPHVVPRPVTDVLKALALYRELVDVEIGRASEHGARWWGRRLVEVYEEAGLVRLDK